jgi:hypothetical protein
MFEREPIASPSRRALDAANDANARIQAAVSKNRRETPRGYDLGKLLIYMARETGLEPATSGVTGRRSNQLSYSPAARFSRARPAG